MENETTRNENNIFNKRIKDIYFLFVIGSLRAHGHAYNMKNKKHYSRTQTQILLPKHERNIDKLTSFPVCDSRQH